MTETDKVKENRLRRIAERRGMKIEKSRRRDPKAVDYGGYMLIDVATNTVITGGSPYPYSASIADVESYLGD